MNRVLQGSTGSGLPWFRRRGFLAAAAAWTGSGSLDSYGAPAQPDHDRARR